MPTKKKEKRGRVTFYLDPDLKTRLDDLAEQTDRTVAKMMRRAIEAYLDVEEEALRKRK
jgi:predicted transcriptional regulator